MEVRRTSRVDLFSNLLKQCTNITKLSQELGTSKSTIELESSWWPCMSEGIMFLKLLESPWAGTLQGLQVQANVLVCAGATTDVASRAGGVEETLATAQLLLERSEQPHPPLLLSAQEDCRF
eukprot:5337772-Amphidinium_carterae.1